MIKPNLTKEREEQLNQQVCQSYKDFNDFLRKRTGKRIFLASASCFIDFFKQCDVKWNEIPKYEILVSTFDESFIQKNMPVLGWLAKTNQIDANDLTKQILIVQAAIQEMLMIFGNTPPTILQSYLLFLNQRQSQRNTKPNSVRTVFQPIIGLYHHYKLENSQIPLQAQIDRYLLKNKGQLTAMVSFVYYLNSHHNCSLVCKRKNNKVFCNPKYKTVSEKSRKEFEKRLIALAMSSRPLSDKQKIQWINNGVKYFHRISVNFKTLSDVRIEMCEEYKDLMLVYYNNESFALPKF